MNNPVLACAQLNKIFYDGATDITVLKNIQLTIEPASTLAIMGSSGSGKSTLLHLLAALDTPTSGDIFWQGTNVADLAEKQKCLLRNKYFGFVYQFHHLLPEFTVLENAAMPLLIGNVKIKYAQEKAESLLAAVGLSHRLAHKVGELSGGERQRVAIARALVADPLCVLADEPTGNLDARNADMVMQAFFSLQKVSKTSIVFVTHDKQLASLAEQTYFLVDGELLKGD